MKECEKEGMMMMCKDWGWCCGHHEKLREVGKEGGWIIMKKQAPQDVVQSIYILGIGGKILKWWGGGCSRGNTHFI